MSNIFNDEMRLIILSIVSLSVSTLFSCYTPQKSHDLYYMKDFNVAYANDFVRKIGYLPAIDEISIVDTRVDGDNFEVNRQSIFLDTSKQDFPNYYNYKRRAREINVPADSLFNCLKTFYKMGVNEFNRDGNYYRFRVIVGFTTNRGYLYSMSDSLHPGDSLPATSVRNRDYHFKVVVVRRVDKGWFEYYETSQTH